MQIDKNTNKALKHNTNKLSNSLAESQVIVASRFNSIKTNEPLLPNNKIEKNHLKSNEYLMKKIINNKKTYIARTSHSKSKDPQLVIKRNENLLKTQELILSPSQQKLKSKLEMKGKSNLINSKFQKDRKSVV